MAGGLYSAVNLSKMIVKKDDERINLDNVWQWFTYQETSIYFLTGSNHAELQFPDPATTQKAMDAIYQGLRDQTYICDLTGL